MSVLALLIAQRVGVCQCLCDLDACLWILEVCLCVVFEICFGAFLLLLMRVWTLQLCSNLSLWERDKYIL